MEQKPPNHATPTRPEPLSSKLLQALVLSVVEHLLVFGIYAARLDGGNLARMSAAVSIGYWVAVLLVVLRHHRSLSWVDLTFVAFGYPVILFPCIYATTGTL